MKQPNQFIEFLKSFCIFTGAMLSSAVIAALLMVFGAKFDRQQHSEWPSDYLVYLCLAGLVIHLVLAVVIYCVAAKYLLGKIW